MIPGGTEHQPGAVTGGAARRLVRDRAAANPRGFPV